MEWKNLPTNLCAEITGMPSEIENYLDRGDKILSQIVEVDPSIIDEEDRLIFVEVVAATEAIGMVTLKSVANVRARKVKEIVEKAVHDLARHRMYASANALTKRVTPFADAESPNSSERPLVGGERIRCKEEDGSYSTGKVTLVKYDEGNSINPLPYFLVEWNGREGTNRCYPLGSLSKFEILPD